MCKPLKVLKNYNTAKHMKIVVLPYTSTSQYRLIYYENNCDVQRNDIAEYQTESSFKHGTYDSVENRQCCCNDKKQIPLALICYAVSVSRLN